MYNLYFIRLIQVIIKLQLMSGDLNASNLDLLGTDASPLKAVGSSSNKKLQPLDIRLKTQSDINGDEKLILKKIKKKKKVKKGYQIATYDAAVDYLKTQTYTKKITLPDGSIEYDYYPVCQDTQTLKHFGLGVYLYLQFIKRLAIAFFFMSITSIATIKINYAGNAMKDYPDSYTMALSRTTLGNIQNQIFSFYLVGFAMDMINCLIIIIFYIHWRSFHNKAVEDNQKDHEILNPSTYALSIVGFDKATDNLQENLRAHFDTLYRGAYQVEVVLDYNRKFHYFMELEALIDQAQKERQVINQTGKDTADLIQIQKRLDQKEKQIIQISQDFDPQFAIIHFRSLKAKFAYINFCRRYALIDKFSSKVKRCLCCLPSPPQNQLFMKNQQLLLLSNNLSRPEQISWENMDIKGCNKLCRMICTILTLAISIFICSTLIGLCTLYAASQSSCTSYDSSTTLAQAKANSNKQILYCYCAANYSVYSSNTAELEAACKDLSNTIIITNVILIVSSLVSSITNTILIFIVEYIAIYILKPASKPAYFSFVFIAIFVASFLNSCLVPLILNGDIFSFKAVSYLTFISFINTGSVSIFSDFNTDWYAIISPYYMNFLIVALVATPISLLVFWLKDKYINWSVRRDCERNQTISHDHPIIQKQANKKITWNILDFPYESSIICLYVFIAIMYSSFIPILLPITFLYLLVLFHTKKAIILKYSLRIPANEDLSSKTMTIIQIALIAHVLFGLWARTADGLFADNMFIFSDNEYFSIPLIFNRVFKDVLMLGLTIMVILWVVIDFFFISCLSHCKQFCCKNQLELPVQFAAIQNTRYQDRLRKVNIEGSYKLINNHQYGHSIQAYRQLLNRDKLKDGMSSEMPLKQMRERQK